MNFSRLLLSATTILLLMVLTAIACKKDISSTSLDLRSTALSASRDGNPCNGNEELANLSYQAIRFGDLEGVFEMYNDIQPVTLEPLAEPVIAVYHSQGRPAAFALMAQQGA
jgi:hypothetical protein